MNKNAILWTIAILIIIILAFWVWSAHQPSAVAPTMTPAASTTPVATAPLFDKSISDGTISLQYPSADFAVATNGQQILLNAVIPACDADFDYCIYYNNSSTYAGTNFESAGLRIEKRPDLTTQAQCLDINPSGYTGLAPVVATSSGYAVSLFSNISSGAAGNLATDDVYRLARNGTCYEFETRVAETDFSNYPSGTINQFTSNDQVALQSELESVLDTLTLPSGATVVFPQL